MKILDLKLQAFGPFVKEQHISFESLNDKGMFLINGPTGTGKTTIFDAITFALYGEGSSKDRNSDDSLRSDFADDSLETYVDLKFEANEQIYRVKRKAAYSVKNKKGNGLTSKPAKIELYMPDGTVISGIKEANDILKNQILFIDIKQFKNVALLAQGEFTHLITASSKERAEILEHIFQKEIYDDVQTKISSLSKNAEQESDAARTSVNTLIDQIEDGENIVGFNEAREDPSNIPTLLDNIDKEISKLELELNACKENTTKVQSEYDEAKSKLSSLQSNNKQIENYILAVNKLEELKKQKDSAELNKKEYDTYQEYLKVLPVFRQKNNSETTIKNIKEKIDSLKNRQAELAKTKQYLSDNSDIYVENKNNLVKETGILNNLSNLSSQQQSLINLKAKVKQEDSNFSLANKAFESLENKYIETRKAFYASSSFNLAKDLEEGTPCPVCGAIHHPCLAMDLGAVSESKFKQVESDYEDEKKIIESKKHDLDTHSSALKTQEEQMVKTLNDNGFIDVTKDSIYSTEINDLIKQSRNKISSLQTAISNYETKNNQFVQDNANVEQALKARLDSLKTNSDDLEKFNKELNDLLESNALFKDLSLCLKYASFNANQAKSIFEKYQNDVLINETTIKNTPIELTKSGKIDESELVATTNLLKEKVDIAISDESHLRNKIDGLNKSKKSIKDKYEDCKDALSKFASLSELAKTANGANPMHIGFKMYILADYFNRIIAQANNRLSKITNGRYKLIRRNLDDAKGNAQQGLDLDVYDVETGKNRPASSLSGGEKFVSALSMALGLSDIIETNHALIRVESIFIDEGFGSLDENYLDMAMKALETLKGDHKTVAIISHVEKLKEYISDGLEVKKADVGSIIVLKQNI